VSESKRLFSDPAPTFQIIPDLAPALFPDPGQNQILKKHKIKIFYYIIQKCLELDC